MGFARVIAHSNAIWRLDPPACAGNGYQWEQRRAWWCCCSDRGRQRSLIPSERSKFSMRQRNPLVWMSVVTHLWTVLVVVAMLAGLLSEGYRSEYRIVARFPHWTKKLYLYTAANFHGTNAMAVVDELVFYNYPIAFNPAKARLALEEKGLKYNERRIDIMNGQSLEPWYMRLNPLGWSPTLVTGKEVLIESMDIIKWADRQGPSLGGDTVDKADVSEWLSKVDAWDGNLFAMANSSAGGMFKYITKWKIKAAQSHANQNPDLADVYKRKIASMNGVLQDVDNTATVESNKKQLVPLLDEAEMRLGKSKFLAGDEYSAADAIFTPVVYRLYATNNDQEYLDSRKNVKQYYQILKQRPSYNKVFGFSDSGIGTARLLLPAVIKIFFSNLIGRYQ